VRRHVQHRDHRSIAIQADDEMDDMNLLIDRHNTHCGTGNTLTEAASNSLNTV